SSRRRHTRLSRDWSSDVCSSDLQAALGAGVVAEAQLDARQGQLGLREARPHLEGVLARPPGGLEVASGLEAEALLVVDVLVERLGRRVREDGKQQGEGEGAQDAGPR